MRAIDQAGTFTLGGRTVKRLGYGAMQLAGPGVFGPPRDRDAALAVLREAVAAGVNHIDTSDFYGPHVTNQIIREALAPYPDDLTIVTKIGARAATTPRGIPPTGPTSWSARCTTTCAIWAWRRWTSSTCGSCSTSTARPRARSPSRSKCWPASSGRAWCATSASAT
jgi:aryl-alcohol dehydrogenase-like predicted oxidoreductase